MKISLFAALIAAAAFCSLAARAQSDPAPLHYASLGDFKLENGQVIRDCKLGYRTVGTLNADKSNAILFPTWFTGISGDIVGLVGPGKFVDGSRFFVIAVDALGDGVSCSPSNSKSQPGLLFPQFSIRDMVASEYQLVTETLHLHHLHAVMGESMGGMQTFQWMLSYPDFLDQAIPIVGSPQLTSYDLMLWKTEEKALQMDPEWMGGKYIKNPQLPVVALIHDMNLTTPRFRVGHTTHEAFPEYFQHVATEGRTYFDANNWLRQLQAMMVHDIAKGSTLEAAAKRVKAHVLIVSASQDHMVDPIPAIYFADLLKAQRLILDSDCGHLSPGCEMDKVNATVNRFLLEK
jgi:homoserine O-acetyltransferase/O-succinyltransferase